MTLIGLNDISFGYPNCGEVFSHLDFKVNKGERIALLGGNGAGKTTLFYVILGLVRPHSGTIELFGKRCSEDVDFTGPRKRIGLLFQDPDDQLFSPSVIEDVSFGPLNLGMKRKEALDISMYWLDRLGIGHLEKRVPYELSGGEKRLVALASVLSMAPEVLLLDEPMAGLEKGAVDRFLSVLDQGEFKTVVVITHMPELLHGLASRTIVMESGRISEQTPC